MNSFFNFPIFNITPDEKLDQNAVELYSKLENANLIPDHIREFLIKGLSFTIKEFDNINLMLNKTQKFIDKYIAFMPIKSDVYPENIVHIDEVKKRRFKL